MTYIYFIRHAHPDYSIHDDSLRPLNEKGLNESKKVTEFLISKKIDVLFSSPYKRAFDTIKDFSEISNLKINIIDNFKERKIEDYWISDKEFNQLVEKQWKDFKYSLPNGESLKEVQKRNIMALNNILAKYDGQTIAIATHGTSLATIINFYNDGFGYKQFQRIRFIMPYIIGMKFKMHNFINMKEFALQYNKAL